MEIAAANNMNKWLVLISYAIGSTLVFIAAYFLYGLSVLAYLGEFQYSPKIILQIILGIACLIADLFLSRKLSEQHRAARKNGISIGIFAFVALFLAFEVMPNYVHK